VDGDGLRSVVDGIIVVCATCDYDNGDCSNDYEFVPISHANQLVIFLWI
jgi:hypothetical protein